MSTESTTSSADLPSSGAILKAISLPELDVPDTTGLEQARRNPAQS